MAQRPNILFIMSDAHAITAYGSVINQTPQLDRIAQGGVRLTDCYCTNSICTSIRATILTGQYGRLRRTVDAGRNAGRQCARNAARRSARRLVAEFVLSLLDALVRPQRAFALRRAHPRAQADLFLWARSGHQGRVRCGNSRVLGTV